MLNQALANSELFASLIATIGAMSAGMAYTLVRMLSQRGVKGPQIVFYFSLFSCLSVVPYLIFNFQPMTFQQIAYLLLAGIAAAGGQFAVTAAYSHSAGRDISIYDYSQVIFAALLGFIAFGQIPDYLSIIGYFVIFMVTFYMYLQNQRENS